MEPVTIKKRKVFAAQNVLHKPLLVSGILASLIYVVANIACAMRYEGYSSVSQTVSELSAIGAPTRTLWIC